MATLEDIRDRFSLDATTNIPERINNEINEVTVLLRQGKQSVTIAATNREEMQQTESFPDLDSKFKALVDQQAELESQKQAFDRLKQHIAQNNKVQDPVEMYKKFKREIIAQQTQTQDKYNKDRSYLNFRQNIWNINHPDEMMPSLGGDEDDDIVVGPSKISLKCPLTTTWFEDPVTNKSCNHTFSRSAIYGLMNAGGYVECPIPGCNRTVTKSNLQPDLLMADRVARARAREREQETQAQEFFDV